MKPNRHRVRVWDKHNNCMFKTGRGVWLNITSDGEVVTGFCSDIDDPDDGRWIIMSSTGIVDKNGTEIFESDVVKDVYVCECGQAVSDMLFTVQLIGGGLNQRDIHGNLYGLTNIHNSEVLGNIHANPELMEAGE